MIDFYDMRIMFHNIKWCKIILVRNLYHTLLAKSGESSAISFIY